MTKVSASIVTPAGFVFDADTVWPAAQSDDVVRAAAYLASDLYTADLALVAA